MNATNYNFDEIFLLMQESFPKNEYREYKKQKDLLKNPHYKILPYFGENNQLLAFAAIWDFESFVFVEHIAVSKQCRGMGIGSKIMHGIIEKSNTNVILEIEPPVDDISKKRLHFYEKLGFKMNEYQYFQMPLNENDKPIPLKILSFPQKLSASKFEKFKKIIYLNVYGIN